MIYIYAAIVWVILSVPVVVITMHCVKAFKLSSLKSRVWFTVVTTFILFPVIMPAGTVAGIPAINIILFTLAVYLGFLGDYFKIIFTLVWYFIPITAVIMWLLSNNLFVEIKDQGADKKG